jgi:uncharacterized protein
MIMKTIQTGQINKHLNNDAGFLCGPLELLVIQATPFCNINCSYCYLPNRSIKNRIGYDTLAILFKKVFESSIVKKSFTVTWHAGEPMVLPIEFYKKAIQICSSANNLGIEVRHNFQTNATLITDKWCDFFLDHDIRVSVSIDGPEFLHDQNRKDRKDRGTFQMTMKGIQKLKDRSIPFSVISVITESTLNYAEEFYKFFREISPTSVGINIEEIENYNINSSLFNKKSSLERYNDFLEKLFDLYYSDINSPMVIREFLQLEYFLFTKDKFLDGQGQQTVPFRILSFDYQGNFSTFSPELLDAKSEIFNDFIFGNVHEEKALIDTLESEKFQHVYSQILKGILNCKKECSYFPVCGGGSPSNKHGENGSCSSTETQYCRYRFQQTFDTYFKKINNILQVSRRYGG